MAVRTDAEIEKEKATEKAAKEARAKARTERAIAAAEGVLLPLGFSRDPKIGQEKNDWHPACWRLIKPRMVATLDLQSKPWNTTTATDDAYTYRLVVSADSIFRVKDIRIAPGNRDGVVNFMARVEEAQKVGQAHQQKLDDLAKRARGLIAVDYPNLKISTVDADDFQVDVRVRTQTGASLHIRLDNRLRFLSLKVDPNEEHATELKTLGAALRAL